MLVCWWLSPCVPVFGWRGPDTLLFMRAAHLHVARPPARVLLLLNGATSGAKHAVNEAGQARATGGENTDRVHLPLFTYLLTAAAAFSSELIVKSCEHKPSRGGTSHGGSPLMPHVAHHTSQGRVPSCRRAKSRGTRAQAHALPQPVVASLQRGCNAVRRGCRLHEAPPPPLQPVPAAHLPFCFWIQEATWRPHE